MMNSSADDDFPANPFRSGGGGNDFNQQQTQQFAMPPQQQQQQQPPPVQQQWNQQPPQQQQQQQQFGGGDQFYDAQPAPHQQQWNEQQSFVGTGMMDNSANQSWTSPAQSSGNVGGGASGGGGDAGNRTWYQKCTDCFTMDTYKAYFDVDTVDIQNRIQSALLTFWLPDHFRNTVVGPGKTDITKGPDLYGPVWITMTLIFIVAVTSNASDYMHYNGKVKALTKAAEAAAAQISNSNSTSTGSGSTKIDVAAFEFSIQYLVRATSVLSTFSFIVPTICWFVTNFALSLQTNVLSLAEWICLYGYSMVPFLPATLVCILPWGFLNWIVLFAATLASVCLIVRNVSTPLIAASDNTKASPIIIALLVTHLIFLLIIKFTFYHHR